MRASARSIGRRKLPHKSPSVSFVTERFVKLVGTLSRKPGVQCDAPDSSLSEVFFGTCNQRPTNSATAHRAQHRQSQNPAATIVMLIAGARHCADHPAYPAVMNGHKRAIALVGDDPLHSHVHFRCCCFISELAHEPGQSCRVVHLAGANRKIETLFVRQDGRRCEHDAKPDVSN